MEISSRLEDIRKARKEKKHYQPFVSVIITTYNQEEILLLNIRAMLNQDYPKELYEIIVADDGSSDGTEENIKEIARDAPVDIKHFFQEDKGFRAGAARNLGAGNGKGELLIFIDSDVIADVDFISNHVSAIKDYDVVCGYAAGHRNFEQADLKNIKEQVKLGNRLKDLGIIGEGRDFIFNNPFYRKSKNNPHAWDFFHSNNFSIRKCDFQEFMFEERFSGWGEEDIELGYRLYKAGKEFLFSKECYAIHYEERNPEMELNYTMEKLKSQIKNMRLFYKLHNNAEIRDYIIRRFSNFPDSMILELLKEKNNKYDIRDMLKINKEANKKELLKQFEAKQEEVTAYPTRVYVELTKNCNLCCKMCNRIERKMVNSPSNDMDFGFFKRIAYEFFPYADFVDLRGWGESLLYPRMDDVIELCMNFDCDFGIITNLAVKNDQLIEKLVDANWWIAVSLDGPDEQTYSKIRGKGNFEKVMRNIKIINERSKKNSSTNKIYLLITVQKDNIDSLPDFIALARENGIVRIELNPVVSNDNSISLSGIEDHAKEKIEQTIIAAKQEEIDLVMTGMFFEKDYVSNITEKHGLKCPRSYSYIIPREDGKYKFHEKCSKGYSHVFFSHNGGISPCNHMMNILIMGAISRSAALKELRLHPNFLEEWNNERFRNYRKKLNSKEWLKDCQNCINRQYPINFS